MYRRWSFGQRVGAGFTLAFVLVLVNSAVSYRSMIFLSQLSVAVQSTQIVRERIDGLLGQMKDAEIGQRGYVITGKPAYLEPYESALLLVDKCVKELRWRITDPNQQSRLDEAVPLINAKFVELKRVIDMRKKAGLEWAANSVSTDKGKNIMDRLRPILQQMKYAEQGLLQQRIIEADTLAAGTKVIILLVTALCLLLLILGGVFITRSFNLMEKKSNGPKRTVS